MLKIKKEKTKCYFYGEFGCLNYAILGHIEEQQPDIIISTQPDYFELMKLKCNKIEKDKDLNIYRAKCVGAGFGLGIKDERIDDLQKLGYKHIKEVLGLSGKRCIDFIKPIKNPLTHEMNLQEEFISISFRKRTHEAERNLPEEDWIDIIQFIKNNTNLKIVAHGMDIDTYDFDLQKPNNIHESIAYMNKSKIFIASMSGIAQFASNCQCPVIQIGEPDRHIEYDPFGKRAEATRLEGFKELFLDYIK